MITQHQIKQAAAAFVKESSVDALAEIIMMTPSIMMVREISQAASGDALGNTIMPAICGKA